MSPSPRGGSSPAVAWRAARYAPRSRFSARRMTEPRSSSPARVLSKVVDGRARCDLQRRLGQTRIVAGTDRALPGGSQGPRTRNRVGYRVEKPFAGSHDFGPGKGFAVSDRTRWTTIRVIVAS